MSQLWTSAKECVACFTRRALVVLKECYDAQRLRKLAAASGDAVLKAGICRQVCKVLSMKTAEDLGALCQHANTGLVGAARQRRGKALNKEACL